MSLDPTGGPAPTPTTGGFDFQLAPRDGGDAAEGGARRDRRGRPGKRVHRNTATTVALAVGLPIILIAAGAGVAWTLVQQSEAEVRAASQPFCDDLASTPGVLDTPAYGWPTETLSQEESIAAIRAYQERWTNLAAIGPVTIRADLTAIATAAGTIADTVESTKTNDRAGNLASIQGVTAQTNVKPWALKYCG